LGFPLPLARGCLWLEPFSLKGPGLVVSGASQPAAAVSL
jgi:hypothetical protein